MLLTALTLYNQSQGCEFSHNLLNLLCHQAETSNAIEQAAYVSSITPIVETTIWLRFPIFVSTNLTGEFGTT
jgi:hypothetical protein